MAFAIRMTMGQERSAFTVANVADGSATGNVEVIVDNTELTSTAFPGNAGQKNECIRLLKEAINVIEAGVWPLA
jgi:hypothetical protein